MKSRVWQRTASILRIIAKIIGIIALVFFLSMIIGDAVTSYQSGTSQGITPEVLFVLIPVVFVLGAFIIAWWRGFLGGILLVGAYLLFCFSPSVHSIFYGEGLEFYIGMFLYALPLLISGVLFILASRLDGRKASKT